jgi:hypothetical protein
MSYKNGMCEKHYDMYKMQRELIIKDSKREYDFKPHYHNLKHSIYKCITYPTIVELCIKMFALADIYFELYNKDELTRFVEADVNKIIRYKVKQIKENREVMESRYSKLFNDIDFRNKWKSNIRTEDGHYVRSRAEQVIDNFLYHHGIVHAYEKLIILEKNSEATLLCDFYIPEIDTYIEYYGKYDGEYISRKKAKDQIYKENNINYIALDKRDLDNLEDILLKQIIFYRSQNKKGQP